jgi:phosphoenolpyruvate carboxykinase (GTP)
VEIKVITYSGRDSDSVLSAATATEVGAKGVRRQPWANEPFIPGPLADYMDAQFAFFNSDKLKTKPIMAGLNYFLTFGARGGEGDNLLGEKRDVKVWLGWLELRAHGDVDAIETPIGFIPTYEDLKELFAGIGKEYPQELYDKQFVFYVDNIIARIDLQEEAYGKEENIPAKLFEVYAEQRKGLEALKAQYGPIVSVEQLIEATRRYDA